MKDWIKNDRIVFKIGSLEWLNYYGLPAGILGLSLIQLFFLFKDFDNLKYDVILLNFCLTLILGIGTYYLQIIRLRFKSFKINKDLDAFKNEIRLLFDSNKWKIDYDNQQYMQATYRGSIFNLDMITLRFKKNEIQWNVIHHPWSHNAIAALLTLNRQGYKMIKQIKAIA
ncbi:MAG: hypothetical protein KDD24_04375 [Flavobacteriales bacterium]|nr:hypothetical protein [Flavobacteriales bacterium]MCB9174991.1 hypothetical protein [Flavobacteriales bacterium]